MVGAAAKHHDFTVSSRKIVKCDFVKFSNNVQRKCDIFHFMVEPHKRWYVIFDFERAKLPNLDAIVVETGEDVVRDWNERNLQRILVI